METRTARGRVAAEVRASISRAGLRASDVATKTGINDSTLSRKLLGKASFSVDELDKIASALEIEMRTFFPPRVRQEEAA
jgi:transcriptional regulator with XRE-family HTH domain